MKSETKAEDVADALLRLDAALAKAGEEVKNGYRPVGDAIDAETNPTLRAAMYCRFAAFLAVLAAQMEGLAKTVPGSAYTDEEIESFTSILALEYEARTNVAARTTLDLLASAEINTKGSSDLN